MWIIPIEHVYENTIFCSASFCMILFQVCTIFVSPSWMLLPTQVFMICSNFQVYRFFVPLFFYKESTSFIHIYHGSRYKLHLDHLEEITTKHIILQIHKSSSLPFYEHQYSISCFHGRFPPSWSLSSPHPTPLISLMIYGHRDPSQASITTLTIAAIVAIHEFFDSAASMSTFINPWGGGIHRGNWACTHTNIFFVPLVYIFFLVSLIYFYNPKRISWHV